MRLKTSATIWHNKLPYESKQINEKRMPELELQKGHEVGVYPESRHITRSYIFIWQLLLANAIQSNFTQNCTINCDGNLIFPCNSIQLHWGKFWFTFTENTLECVIFVSSQSSIVWSFHTNASLFAPIEYARKWRYSRMGKERMKTIIIVTNNNNKHSKTGDFNKRKEEKESEK